jgi:C-terminal processing protease CtpA/Prc
MIFDIIIKWRTDMLSIKMKIEFAVTVIILLLSASVCCLTKSYAADFNFGFEKTTPNQKLPDNWFEWGSGYLLSIDTTVKHSGKNSVLIKSPDNRTTENFGCAAYSIPAIYEGKEIELRAYMKLKDIKDGSIGLMLRIDGPSGGLAFDNMQQKNIQGTSDWKMYSVVLKYPEDANTIYIGAILSGTGELWVDDFELLIDGKDIKEAKHAIKKEYKADKDKEFDNGSKIATIKISEEKINNLQLLGLVWGFLKYYHPNIAKGDFNWDYELFRILPKIIQSQNLRDRDNILINWIKNLGAFELADESKKIENDIKIKPDLDWIINSNLSDELKSQLKKIKNGKRTLKNYYIDLSGGAGNPQFKNEIAYQEMLYPDAGYRLLSLFRYWNIIQYFFPYKNLIEEDWKNVLKESIPKFINASNEIEYKLAVLDLMARVHDTHSNIWGNNETLNNYLGKNFTPIEIKFIENKAVVTDLIEKDLGKESGLQIGDEITKINTKPVNDIVVEKLKYTPASNYPTQLRDIAGNLLRTNDSTIKIEFSRNGITHAIEIKTYSTDKINVYKRYPDRDTCFKLINPDIAYLYPGTIKNDYLPDIMNAVKNTKGLIIDFRCYPSDFIVFSLGEYLFPDSTAFVKFSMGSITEPGTFTMTSYNLKVGEKNNDYYKGKVIILINENTQSSAEYHTMALRTAPKATVIGSTTAGADGNVSLINLPGGITTMISGIGIYYPDGRETQRIGIVPDIEVKPTIKGIKEGRDEILEKAIELINK